MHNSRNTRFPLLSWFKVKRTDNSGSMYPNSCTSAGPKHPAGISTETGETHSNRNMGWKKKGLLKAFLNLFCIKTSSSDSEDYAYVLKSSSSDQTTTSEKDSKKDDLKDETIYPEVDDEWTEEAFQELVGDLSEWTAEVIGDLNHVMAGSSLDSLKNPIDVEPELNIHVPEVSDPASTNPVCAMSDCIAEDVLDASDDHESSRLSELDDSDHIEINSCKYKMGKKIGEGGFGSIFEGTRLKDGLKVALKFAEKLKKEDEEYIHVEGYPKPLPLEIGLLILANKGPRVPQIIQLLDWEELPDTIIMVLERPIPCEDLFDYFVERNNGYLKENVVATIMMQVAFAAHTCCKRGVLHRDIKLENLLINPDTLEVKLIDFGCGTLLKESAYTKFGGTRKYVPPEFDIYGEYHGEPATVWSLGVLMFVLLNKKFPEPRDLIRLNNNTWRKKGFSKGCCKLLCSLLQRDPKKRLELEKVHLSFFA